MKINHRESVRPACSLCGQIALPIFLCEGGYVCDSCAETARAGRDKTTKEAKKAQRSKREQAEEARSLGRGEDVNGTPITESEVIDRPAAEFLPVASASIMITGGEVKPRHNMELADTLAVPGVAALDASANRLELISIMGTDVAAMALDAADTISASNSLEKMLAHQMAVCHNSAMRYVSKASLEQDPAHAVRMMNLSVRLMDTFQSGLITLKRLRGTGEQRITIQHVNVTDGGQAVIGQVQAGGGGAK
jgi:hypothetical protein